MYHPNDKGMRNLVNFSNAEGANDKFRQDFFDKTKGGFTLFSDNLTVALANLNAIDLNKRKSKFIFSILVGGSTGWQYVDAIVHNKPLNFNSDLDYYAMVKSGYQDLIKENQFYLKLMLSDTFKVDIDDIKERVGHFLNLKKDGNDFSVAYEAEILFNFQILINNAGFLYYKNESHENDFKKFIFENKIIGYGLEAFLKPAAMHANKLLNDLKTLEGLEKSPSSMSKEDVIAFEKLGFVFKSLYKPFKAGKGFDLETAKFFHHFLEEYTNLRNWIVTFMAVKYPDVFKGQAHAEEHMLEVENQVKKVYDPIKDLTFTIQELKETINNERKMFGQQRAFSSSLVMKAEQRAAALEYQLHDAQSRFVEDLAQKLEEKNIEMASKEAQSQSEILRLKKKLTFIERINKPKSDDTPVNELRAVKEALNTAQSTIQTLESQVSSSLQASRELSEQNQRLSDSNQQFREQMMELQREMNAMKAENASLKLQTNKLTNDLQVEKERSKLNTQIVETEKFAPITPIVLETPSRDEGNFSHPSSKAVTPAESLNPNKKRKKKNKKSEQVNSISELSPIYISFVEQVLSALAKSTRQSFKLAETDKVHAHEAVKASLSNVKTEDLPRYADLYVLTILSMEYLFKLPEIGKTHFAFAFIESLPWEKLYMARYDVNTPFKEFPEMWKQFVNFMNHSFINESVNKDFVTKMIATGNAFLNLLYESDGSPKDVLISSIETVLKYYDVFNKHGSFYVKSFNGAASFKRGEVDMDLVTGIAKEIIAIIEMHDPTMTCLQIAKTYFVEALSEECTNATVEKLNVILNVQFNLYQQATQTAATKKPYTIAQSSVQKPSDVLEKSVENENEKHRKLNTFKPITD